ncbi:hypothetical protein HU200_062821 [Digitaria exilis]|uniref:Anaphase-promoting complex subunit 1 n=1 Tax=Digitaria exilis TaxID=1010633 RepID=A0A835DZP3_9POAL|nr:hypothetical protein HU200_062821 [Digitaria exilis]
MASAIGLRRLTVLREFRPHGLVVEEADGEGAARSPQDYDYFLFDPALAASPGDEASASGADGDHELFIRGNQCASTPSHFYCILGKIIWSNGSRVHKRYISPNTVIMACWCRMNAISDALLCVLQVDTLSLYNVTGEVVSVPLPYAVSSIWPLPFGLLLQKSADGGHMVSSSSSLLDARDLNRPNKDYGLTYSVSCQTNTMETDSKANGCLISSHLILKHPLEEPQATYFEENDKLTMMKDFDEKIIWTSDAIPLMASYHKGKSQHSVWQIDGASYQEATNDNTMLPVSCDISSHKCAFRKIWQGKFSQSTASKVFLATDIDGFPIICFLLHEQKLLLAVRIQVDDTTEEAFGDIKPHMSWNIPAFAAAPVVVTRPRVRVGGLPFTDILILSSDNDLLLYVGSLNRWFLLICIMQSGKQCLCRYTLPTELGKAFFSNYDLNPDISDTGSDLKITSIADAVEGRINVTCNNGLMLRCSLRKNPSSSLDEHSSDVSFYIRFMRETLETLHALYENLKLNILRKGDLGCLASLLCMIASSLGEHTYVDYYCRDFTLNLNELPSVASSTSLRTPPSLFRWFEYCLRHGCDSAKLEDIPTLMRKQKVSAVSWGRKVVSFYSLLLGAEMEGKNLSSGVYSEVASGSARNPEELTVLAMVAEKFGRQQLDLLPVGVSLVLRHALDKCRDSPPDDWPATAYVLVGREDLAMAKVGSVRKDNGLWHNDNLTSISVPYMLHLQPVTIPTTASDIPTSKVLNSEDSDSVYKSIEDGMEHIFTSTTQLRFGHDLRLNEVCRVY